MAAIRRLPLVFVCENNLYAEFTPMADATAGASIAARAGAYGVPSAVVDGNDIWAVHTAAQTAVNRARAGDGPTLLECQTYRHYGHSKSDPAPYRTEEELQRWLARDPVKIARERLISLGVAEEEIADSERATTELMDRAVQRALAAPYPDVESEAGTEFSS